MYRTRFPHRPGSVVVLVMIFLALFASLAVAFSAATNTNLNEAHNYQQAQRAQMAAESGMAYMIAHMRTMSIPAREAEQDLLLAVANRLAAAMDGTANLGSGEITLDLEAVRVPAITIDNGRNTFRSEIRLKDNGPLEMRVIGAFGQATRTVQIDLRPNQGYAVAFDFGVASKGKILVGGDGTVKAAHHPSEADVLSATYSTNEAIVLSGSCRIDGDIYTSNPDSYVTVSGNPTVAGQTKGQGLFNHIHTGVGDVEFPEVDTSVYIPYATNVLGSSTNLGSNLVLENVRIPAGMNPTFSGQVDIKGVLYIEQPNQVKFAGGSNVTGVIVTDDAGPTGYQTNSLEFQGNMNINGVETLPDLPQFHELRQMPGTAMLAPGFSVNMTGSFGIISGAVVADQFSITGSAGGVINGPIVCYGDTEFTLWGSATVTIDRGKYDNDLPGFLHPLLLIPAPGTYAEIW